MNLYKVKFKTKSLRNQTAYVVQDWMTMVIIKLVYASVKVLEELIPVIK